MITLRTEETEQKYAEYRKTPEFQNQCPLCRIEPIQLFTYWKIIPNTFPYDRVAQRHDMLTLLRHDNENGLTKEEEDELKEIRKGIIAQDTYTYLLEATSYNKSVPAHFHWHLITLKEN